MKKRWMGFYSILIAVAVVMSFQSSIPFAFAENTALQVTFLRQPTNETFICYDPPQSFGTVAIAVTDAQGNEKSADAGSDLMNYYVCRAQMILEGWIDGKWAFIGVPNWEQNSQFSCELKNGRAVRTSDVLLADVIPAQKLTTDPGSIKLRYHVWIGSDAQRVDAYSQEFTYTTKWESGANGYAPSYVTVVETSRHLDKSTGMLNMMFWCDTDGQDLVYDWYQDGVLLSSHRKAIETDVSNSKGASITCVVSNSSGHYSSKAYRILTGANAPTYPAYKIYMQGGETEPNEGGEIPAEVTDGDTVTFVATQKQTGNLKYLWEFDGASRPALNTNTYTFTADAQGCQNRYYVVQCVIIDGNMARYASSMIMLTVSHPHTYQWTTVRTATKTQTGLRTGVCSCGKTTEEVLPRLGTSAVSSSSKSPAGNSVTSSGSKPGSAASPSSAGNSENAPNASSQSNSATESHTVSSVLSSDTTVQSASDSSLAPSGSTSSDEVLPPRAVTPLGWAGIGGGTLCVSGAAALWWIKRRKI